MKNMAYFSRFFALALVFLAWQPHAQAQSSCPACTISLPASLPADTVYLDTFPNAVRGQYYEENLSFRFPYTSTPLAALQPGTPSGLSLQSFTIISITGLPAGLSAVFDRPLPAVYNETSPRTRDGCVMVCGTPLQSGTFTVNIAIRVATGIIAPTDAVIPVTFEVEQGAASLAFNLSPAVGCDSFWVNFENLFQPLPGQSVSYDWDFGNGETSSLEQPDSVYYRDTGTYTISYRAIATTVIPSMFLNRVSVVNGCNFDFFNNRMLSRLRLNGNEQAASTVISSAPRDMPFDPAFELQPATQYSVEVARRNSIIGGNGTVCTTVFFNSDTLAGRPSPVVFSIQNGSNEIQIELLRDTLFLRDTTESTEIVLVEYCGPPIAVNRVQAIQDLELFPNPSAGGPLNLAYFLAEQGEVRTRVLDLYGRTVFEELRSHATGYVREQLNLPNLPAGMYLVELETKNQRHVFKWVLSR